jgi:hypothetical protein
VAGAQLLTEEWVANTALKSSGSRAMKALKRLEKSGVPLQSPGRGGHSLAEARLWQI